jgi:nitrogenase molybdenum-iron protein alpha/beta subunit
MRKDEADGYEKAFEKIIQKKFLSKPEYSYYLTDEVRVSFLPFAWNDFWEDESNQIFRIIVKLKLKPIVLEKLSNSTAESIMGKSYWSSTSVDFALDKTDFVNYFDSDMSAFNLEMDILRQFSKLGIRWSSSSSEVLFME